MSNTMTATTATLLCSTSPRFNNLPDEIQDYIFLYLKPRSGKEAQSFYLKMIKTNFDLKIVRDFNNYYNSQYFFYNDNNENHKSYKIFWRFKSQYKKSFTNSQTFKGFESVEEFILFLTYARTDEYLLRTEHQDQRIIFYKGFEKMVDEIIHPEDFENAEPYEIPQFKLTNETRLKIFYHNYSNKILDYLKNELGGALEVYNIDGVVCKEYGLIHINEMTAKQKEKYIINDKFEIVASLKNIFSGYFELIKKYPYNNAFKLVYIIPHSVEELERDLKDMNKNKYDEVIKQMKNNYYKPTKKHLITFQKKLCKFENEKKLNNRDIIFLKKPYLMENIFNEMKKNNTHGVGGGWVRRVNPLREYLGLKTLKE